MIDESVLSQALRDLADEEPVGPPPVPRLLRRGHRGRTGRALALGATAIAGTVVASTVVAAGVVAPPQHRTAPPGRDRLLLAAHDMQETTYRYTLQWRINHHADRAEYLMAESGAKDPIRDRSIVWMAGIPMIQIGPDCWYRDATRADWQHARCAQIPASDPMWTARQDPAQLLQLLQRIASVRYAGRSGTVDTYTVTFTPADGPYRLSAGTVEVDANTTHIVHVHFESGPTADPGARFDINFTDIGAPVDIVPPD